MRRWITCKKCGTPCKVDGDYPKFFAFCDTCDDYATYDMDMYAADWMADEVDSAELRMEAEYDYD